MSNEEENHKITALSQQFAQSQAVIMETIVNANEKENQFSETQNQIRKNAEEYVDYEKKLTEFAKKILCARDKFENDKKIFLLESENKQKEINIQIQQAQNELLLAEKAYQDVLRDEEFVSNAVDELKHSIQLLESQTTRLNEDDIKMGGMINTLAITQKQINLDEINNDIENILSKIQYIDGEIKKQNNADHKHKIEQGERILQITTLEAQIEYLTQRKKLLEDEHKEKLEPEKQKLKVQNTQTNGEKSNSINAKNEATLFQKKIEKSIKHYFKSKSCLIDLKNQQQSKKSKIEETKKNVNIVESEKRKIQESLDNFIKEKLKIRSIKLKTIGELKTKAFEIIDTINKEKNEIEKLYSTEMELAQEIRKADSQIECARVDSELLLTNEISLSRLKSHQELRESHAVDIAFALQDELNRIESGISAAKTEENTYNEIYKNLLLTKPKKENKSLLYREKLKISTRERKVLAKAIIEIDKRRVNLSNTIKKIEKELERTKGNIYVYEIQRRQLAIKSPSIDNSGLNEAICERKRRIEDRKKSLQKMKTTIEMSLIQLSTPMQKKKCNKRTYTLTLEDILWAIQSESYIWRGTRTVFAHEILMHTWLKQLDLFLS